MQWIKYVGIPYLDKGRDTAGIDCWGLARLVYKDEFNVELPSLTENYEHDSTARISELIAIQKEGWVKVEEPKPGHLIVFRVLGKESHIGIYIGQNKFLHARERYSSSIERLDSVQWRNRIAGFYEYSEAKLGAVLTAQLHPLQTKTITVPVPAGTSVKILNEYLIKEYNINGEMSKDVVILINGRVVPKDEYSTLTVNDNDVVQYRNVAGKSALRIILTIVVAIYAPYIAGWMQSGVWGAAAVGASGAALTVAVTAVGMLLVNAIAPIRPPSEPGDPGSPSRQLLMQGGANQENKYGAIPVVLGRVRMTPPLGARNYIESADENSDLNIMLAWGFGPLKVTDLYIGATGIDQYENGISNPVQYATLNNTLDYDDEAAVNVFNNIYASDIEQNYHGIRLVNNATDGAGDQTPWTESTLREPDIVRLGVNFNFPQGLRHLIAKGDNAGAIYAKECLLEIQYRALGINGEPLYDWLASTYISKSASSFSIPLGMYTYTTTSNGFGSQKSTVTATINYYRWTRIALDQGGNWVIRTGAYLSAPYGGVAAPFSVNSWYSYRNSTRDPNAGKTYVTFPEWVNDEIPVLDICMYGNQVHIEDTSARRADYSYSGFVKYTSFGFRTLVETVSYYKNLTGNVVSEASEATKNYILTAGFTAKNNAIISLGLTNYVKRKDPFSHTQYISVPPNPGGYQVRVRRRNDDRAEPDDTNRYMHDVALQTVTGYTNRVAIIDPPNCRITRTAMRIRATDQLNGRLDGINGLVETICLDWDRNTQTWVYATTNNPASLFRYILQHPANAQRILEADAANRIDLDSLQQWHEYCQDEGFEFNVVVAQQRSLLEVLKDVCAAGRASPITIDGKWGVVIDRERFDVVQHFTPHNSWGFEATKRLPKQPDGLKVTFSNEDRGFQEEEVIVYGPGKNEANSEVFEQISLPGVTKPSLVEKHCLWHFAQAKLRPEVYVLNTDMEYLIATRGDRVKVRHDVTMWGLSSGRIKNRITGSLLELDEPVPMKAGVSYSIRIRSSNGSSVVSNIVPALYDNYYDRITLTQVVTEAQASPLDLFMFGEVNAESHDLVILGIEPYAGGNARITMSDYSPEIYDINYQTEGFSLPDFNTAITRDPELLIHSVYVTPNIVSIISDETVLERLSPGVFKYNLKVAYTHASYLPERVTGVEVQIDYAEDTVDNWLTSGMVPLNMQTVTFGDVVEGDIYKIRARYVVEDGRTGPWTVVENHTIVGKSRPPSVVTGLTKVLEPQSATFKFEWSPNTEVDIKGYEVRTSDSGWGDTNYVYRGTETTLRVPTPTPGSTITYYVRAYDYSSLYSLVSAVDNANVSPPSVPRNLNYTYAVQSVSGTTAVIDWDAPATIGLPLSHYKINIIKPQGTVVVNSLTTEYLTIVNWLQDATAEIVAVDTLGAESPKASITLPKAPPETPGVITYNIASSSVVLDWPDSVAGSLPVAGYDIRIADSGWGVNSNYLQRTNASTYTITNPLVGNNTWYIRAYDTAGQYSASSRSLSLVVAIPNAPTGLDLSLTDTNLSGAQAVLKWNASTISTFAIKEYEATLTKYPGPIVNTYTTSGTSVSLPVDWKDSVSAAIVAIDILGNRSNAATAVFNKLPPGNVGTVTVTPIVTGGVTLTWPIPAKGTLAIDGYEIRTQSVNPGTPGFVYRGSTNNTTIPTVLLGTNTWYIWAYDTDGHYSTTPTIITFTASAPGPATGLTSLFNSSSNTTSTCILRWTPPTGAQFNINRYEVTFAYTNPVTSSITVNRDTTDWEVPANWIGDATLSVKVIDVLGNSSTTSTLAVTKQLPNTPGVCTTTPVGTILEIDWPDTAATTLPVTLYELRTTDSGWGSAGYIWKGTSSSTQVGLSGLGAKVWYLKSVDSDGRYSAVSRQINYTISAPPNPVTYPAEFADTSLTSATVTLFWDPVVTTFGIQGYEVTYNGTTELVNSTTITLPANWLGEKNFTIKTVDGLGNKSSGSLIVATQLHPNPASNFRAQVIDNNVLLYWNMPEKTTLPVSHVTLRKGSTWETATVIGDKDGTFTSISELSGGNFTYWLAVVDTDGNQSTPISLTASVSQPPDFIFNAEYISTFSGTLNNAAFDSNAQNAVVLPVNTVENFAQHFTNNGWDQPSDQVAAGFPIYIQPGVTSGYYEEVFDYGTILGSSQITLSITGASVYGNPALGIIISTSLDNVTYSDFTGSSSVFAANFRYVKIRITVTQQTSGDLYRISGITVRLDAKQKSDAGNVAASSVATLGSVVNFAQEFIDVVSVTLSAQGTTPLNPVYDLKDEVIVASYSVDSNVATINATAHGLVAGQRVKLSVVSGPGVSSRYLISSVINANSYTVSMVAPNGSGNVSTYPNSMRVYLFDQAGNRTSGNVSWAVRGY